MARPEPDFTSRMAPLMLAYAQRQGVEVHEVMSRFRISQEAVDFAQPGRLELTLSSSVLRELADALAEALGDAHFGLKMATELPKGVYGVGEFVATTSPTMRAVFENFVRFNGIISPHQVFHFTEVRDEVEIHTHTPRHRGGIGRHLNEYSLAVQVRSVRSMAAVEVKRVWFASERPESVERLTAFFGTTKLSFSAATTGFSLSAAVLSLPNQRGDEALNAFLTDLAKQALDARPKTDELVDRLRMLIRDSLREGEPNVERLAARMHMSARTLQRRLAAVKTSFQDVLDDVRFDLARAYLRDERLDMSQVAYLLGYSELRAFDRAFKRWAGLAPREWRSRPG